MQLERRPMTAEGLAASLHFSSARRYPQRMRCSRVLFAALGIFTLAQINSIAVNLSLPPANADAIQADSPESKATIIKLDTLIIPKVDFEKETIPNIIEFFSKQSRELDPQHVGIKFETRIPRDWVPPTPYRRVASVTLDDVPLVDLLGYVVVQTGLEYKVVKGVVVLSPIRAGEK